MYDRALVAAGVATCHFCCCVTMVVVGGGGGGVVVAAAAAVVVVMVVAVMVVVMVVAVVIAAADRAMLSELIVRVGLRVLLCIILAAEHLPQQIEKKQQSAINEQQQ